MEKALLSKTVTDYNSNEINDDVDSKLNKEDEVEMSVNDTDSELDHLQTDYLDFSPPTASSVKTRLIAKKCQNAVKISQKYGEFIEDNQNDIAQLYEDLCSDKSDLIAYFREEFMFRDYQWTDTKALWLRIVLMQLIEETQPEIQKMMEFEKCQIDKAQQVKNYLSGYATITVSSALVFTFGVNLASRNLSSDGFEKETILYIFHVLISTSIICCLHALLVTSYFIYNTYRALGGNKVDYAKKYLGTTYHQRNEVRVTFVIGLLAFACSVSVLYFDDLPVPVACTNAGLLLVGLIVIAIRAGVIPTPWTTTKRPGVGFYAGPKSVPDWEESY